MQSISIDVALYGVDCTLTDDAKTQIEEFLERRWNTKVVIDNTNVVAFDLEATKDAGHDSARNEDNIHKVLLSSNVLIVGMNAVPMYALGAFIEAIQKLDTKVIPFEVFAVVMDHDKNFQRFSHLNLYKREQPAYVRER